MKALVAPTSVRLEASSRCQLRCPSCPTTTKAINPVVGSGLLKLSDFCEFLELNPRIRNIELSNYGEVFLNPDLLAMLEHASAKKVTIYLANGVNLNNASEQVLEGLVKYGVGAITCSIDGASQETYSQYRVRGDYARVMENVRLINQFKEKHQSSLPVLTWQFIIFGHNEHEVVRAREIAREMKMEIRFKLSWDAEFSPMRDIPRVLRETGLPAASREEYAAQTGTDYKVALCRQLWDQPQINWDGKSLGCGRNFWGEFGGNVFRDGLLQVANSERMNYARSMLVGASPDRPDIPCTTCSVYQQMAASGKWLEAPAPSRTLVREPFLRLKIILREKLRRGRTAFLRGTRILKAGRR